MTPDQLERSIRYAIQRRKGELALRTSEERLSLATDAARIGYWDWDLRGERATWSERTKALLGIPAGTEPSYPVFLSALYPEDRERTERAMAEALAQHKEYDTQYRVVWPDGSVHWLYDKGRAIYDDTERPLRMVGMVLEITQRKQQEEALRESEERFRGTFENAAVGISHMDRNGQWLQVNEKLCDLLGYSREELLQTNFLFITHPDEREAEAVQYRRLMHGEIESYFTDKRFVRKDGHEVWLRVTRALQRGAQGQPLYSISVVQDISDRKRAEENLREANERLAEANTRLAEADRRKDEFLAMLAHELRNPLAPIRNAVQVLRLTGPADPTTQRQKEVIDRQVTHLVRLVDDLLDVSRITRDKIALQKEPVIVCEIVARALETVQPLIESRRHRLYVALPDNPLHVEADPVRLTQVVANLLNNAAKYTDEGGQIWLSVARENGRALIKVRDSGAGIRPEMLQGLFDLFTQAERSLDRAQGGLGIGLYLVRRLVEMHGGIVQGRSSGPNQGSEFTVSLPLLYESRQMAPELARSVPAGHAARPAAGAREITHKILIVEDNMDAAGSLAELLEIWGQQVRAVHDGPAAVEAALEFRPDIILLDIGLPGMNGYEVARRLRREPALEGATLVALTGYGQEEDRRKAEEAGFDRHFTKPVDPEALQSLLDQAA